jgi:hypothetical protein
MKRLICLTTLVILGSISAFADLPRPDKSPNRVEKPRAAIDTEMDISLDRNAKEARLIIPKSQLKQLRAELERLDDGSDNTAAVASPGEFTRVQTIVSGMFLSLAFIFGGIWFVRSGKAATGTGRAFVILAVLAGIGSAATFVYANAGPPNEARSITGKMFAPSMHTYGFGWGKVKLEAGDDDRIKLIVPNPKTAATTNGEE